MKVSVAIITYNQSATIAQTIESILMQKGDFELEIVIGEDCSKDDTLAICREYESKYPNIVKVLSGPQNLGILGNFVRTIKSCNGEFIGDIAGDDYYYDDHALAKQVAFFQSHPDYGVLAVNGYRYYVRQDKWYLGITKADIPDGDVKSFFFGDTYHAGVYAIPVGMMYRRTMLDLVDFDEFIRRGFPAEDDPLQAVLSQYTKFAQYPDPLVVYRVYKESNTHITVSDPRYMEYHRGLMKVRKYLNDTFPDDVKFDDAWIADYLFYKEFLLYVHQLNYKRAKQLVSIQNISTRNVSQARKYTKCWFKFIVFHWYKEYTYYRQVKDI